MLSLEYGDNIQIIQNEEMFCIYYKESLGVREVKLSNLSQCVICEVSLQNCKGYIGVVYRYPCQDSIEFENFLSDFDELPSKTASTNSLFTIIDHDPPWMNDFVKNKMKWKHQIHKTYKKMVTHTVTISSFKKQLVSFLN